MLAGMILMAAAVVGGEWTEGNVRFETGSGTINGIVSAKPSGAYGSKIVAAYELLRHTGETGPIKKDWLEFDRQMQQATSNRCDRAMTDDNFTCACWRLLEARMMCELETAYRGRLPLDPKYVPMNLAAAKFMRERYVKDGMLAKPLRGQALPSAFALYLGIVDDRKATADGLKAALESSSLPSLGAFEWRVVLDALAWNGKADVAYGLLLKHPRGIDSGAAHSWLWRTAAGIASDPTVLRKTGFRNIIMAPKSDRRLGFVKAEYKSAAGVIKSAWRYEGGKWIWDFTVPRNSTASVTLPGQILTRHYDGGDHHIELNLD